jgi:hypothetical protein
LQGSIIFNGNIQSEADLIRRFRDRILDSHHEDPAVRNSLKVLMVTAAWKKDEYNEAHIRAALNAVGVPSRYENGYDVNIQNLSVYHEFNTIKHGEPELHRQYHAKQDVIKEAKLLYRRKNSHLVSLLKEQYQILKKSFPEASLSDVLHYPAKSRKRDLAGLSSRQIQYHFWCQDIQETMQTIVATDEKMVDLCNDLDLYFLSSSGLNQNARYRETRQRLEQRILSANSIFLFGGHVAVLYNRLNFFKLKPAFVEALRRGTNFYAISAGNVVLCKSIILYDDFADDRRVARDFEFFDNGFGIVTKVQIFPHCMDRIKTEDADNLAYLANRFQSSRCVGLNQESYLLLETVPDASGRPRERFVSVGEKDGVYVFDRRGRKFCKGVGEELDVEE